MTGEKRRINNANALYKNIHVWRNEGAGLRMKVEITVQL